MSHREGALLRGLMFPGPFQFFHPETQRETDVNEYKTSMTRVSSSKLIKTHTHAQAKQCHTVQPTRMIRTISSQSRSSGSTAGL